MLLGESSSSRSRCTRVSTGDPRGVSLKASSAGGAAGFREEISRAASAGKPSWAVASAGMPSRPHHRTAVMTLNLRHRKSQARIRGIAHPRTGGSAATLFSLLATLRATLSSVTHFASASRKRATQLGEARPRARKASRGACLLIPPCGRMGRSTGGAFAIRAFTDRFSRRASSASVLT